MFIVFLYFVVLLCFYWLNIAAAVILLYWPHVSEVVVGLYPVLAIWPVFFSHYVILMSILANKFIK